jgi:hypothetical protein
LDWRGLSLQYASFSSEVDMSSSKLAERGAETRSSSLVRDLKRLC